jgi:hypothetical protein
MGRFTMRDEGKTIALGKVLKYKPSKLQAASNLGDITKTEEVNKAAEEEKKQAAGKNEDGEQIDTSSHTKKGAEDMVFDLDSGDMLTKEEYHRRQAAKNMEEINEGDEEDDDDDDEEDG